MCSFLFLFQLNMQTIKRLRLPIIPLSAKSDAFFFLSFFSSSSPFNYCRYAEFSQQQKRKERKSCTSTGRRKRRACGRMTDSRVRQERQHTTRI